MAAALITVLTYKVLILKCFPWNSRRSIYRGSRIRDVSQPHAQLCGGIFNNLALAVVLLNNKPGS
jgi:hypothetical protein